MGTPVTVTLQGTADAGGRVELAFPVGSTVPAGAVWLVQRLVLFSESGTDPAFTVHIGSEVSNDTRRDGTPSSIVNAADYVHPLPIPEGAQLFGVFTGADPGARCSLVIQYERRQGGGAS